MINEKPILSENAKKDLYRRRILSAATVAALLSIAVAVTITVGQPLLYLVSDGERFRLWVAELGWMGPLMFIGIMALQVVVAFIPGEVVEISAGYAFGAIPGMFLCLVGAALGSSIIYGFTKVFGRRLTETFISREKISSLKFIRDSKQRNMLVFILFFIPGTPKDIITYFIGLTPMKLYQFLMISSVARIPSVISSTLGGSALGIKNYDFAILVFVVTAIVSLIGLLVYHHLAKKKGKLS